MLEELTAGDIVKVKSGGPAMTVALVQKRNRPDDTIHCTWMDSSGNKKTDTFWRIVLDKPNQ